jgi:very-short-patch-repair endonuclease
MVFEQNREASMKRRMADGAIARVAALQHGLFTRADAHSVGLTDRQLRLRVAQGRIERLSRHAFRIAGHPTTWRQRLLAACLAAGPGAAASHRSAAALHRFDDFAPGVVEITVPQGRRDFRMDGVIVHSSAYWGDIDVCEVDGIPVSTPERTLCTLAAVTDEARVEHALDGAERDGTVRREDVAEAHADVRERGRNGVAALGRLLEKRADLLATPHSVLERRFLRVLEEHNLPRPECQVPVRRPDGRMAYLDSGYPDLRLFFELDGNVAHATPAQRSADNVRANALGLRDIRIVRFTYEQVVHQPEMVATTVRAHLRERRRAA